MIKAVFIDYMGTLVQEDSEYAGAVIGRCVKQSDAESPAELAEYWFRMHDILIGECRISGYRTEYEIARQVFEMTMEKFHFTDSAEELCEMLTRHWMYSPIYPDAISFLQSCPMPVYVVSSNDTKYLEEGLKRTGTPVAGVITSESARAYKPDAGIFTAALTLSGCRPEEVVHIGDSLHADGDGASGAGITPLILDRRGKIDCGYEKISSLKEAFARLEAIKRQQTER